MDKQERLLQLTAEIVSTHVSRNSVSANDLPQLIANVHESLSRAGEPSEPEQLGLQPAVSIRASIKPDYLVCLESGKKFKMLKRHLMTSYNMTPEQYRERWGLPSNYPMVAPNYAAARRNLAIKLGLGQKGQQALAEEAATTSAAKPARDRKTKSEPPSRPRQPTRRSSVAAGATKAPAA